MHARALVSVESAELRHECCTDSALDGAHAVTCPHLRPQDFVAGRGRQMHVLPLDKFVPSRQGRVVRDAARLDPSAVTGIGFALSLYTAEGEPNSKFGDGPFSLELHSVEVRTK